MSRLPTRQRCEGSDIATLATVDAPVENGMDIDPLIRAVLLKPKERLRLEAAVSQLHDH